VKLEKKEAERRIMLEREKFFERARKKKELDYQDKLEFYEIKVKEMNEQYKKKQKRIRHKLFRVRIPGRRDSDGMLDVNFPFEEFHFDLEKQIEKKKLIKEDNNIFEIPIMKDRLHYSFIWDRYTLYEADNIQDLVRIDPTDHRLNLGSEIDKLLNKNNKLNNRKMLEKLEQESRTSYSDSEIRSFNVNSPDDEKIKKAKKISKLDFISKMSHDILDNNTKSGGPEELMASDDGSDLAEEELDMALLAKLANNMEDVRGSNAKEN
jgi:hypothetical protein